MSDKKLAKKACLEIKNKIHVLTHNIDFILENQDLLNSEKLHAPIGYIAIGCQAVEAILDEIRNPR